MLPLQLASCAQRQLMPPFASHICTMATSELWQPPFRRRPVANFGYEDGPSLLVSQPDEAVWEFDSTTVDVAAALRVRRAGVRLLLLLIINRRYLLLLLLLVAAAAAAAPAAAAAAAAQSRPTLLPPHSPHLQLLCDEVGGSGIKPGVNCRGAFCSAARPTPPTGRLTPASLCLAVASMQPPDAIIGEAG